jgi:CheY-like chemotaxis protein
MDEQAPVLVVDDDLIFVARILRTLQSLDLPAVSARDAAIAAERLASDRPWLVLVNGASRSIDAAHVATAAKRISPPPFVLAYGPHVRLAELAGPLREAGADRVVANSAIHERLPAIVRQRLDAALDVPASERA